MARKRMIDPSIWADSRFGKMSPDAQIMFIGMFCNADDEGRLPGDALYLSAIIFPYRGLTQKQAITIRDEVLSKMKSVVLYEIEEQEYIQFKKWSLYQSINRPSPSKYPPFTEESLKDHVSITPNRIEENRIEKNRIEKNIHDDEHRVSSEENLTKKTPEPKPPIEIKLTPIQEIVGFYETTCGTKVTNWGKQSKAVDSMLKAGYSPEIIKKTINFMRYKDEFYKDKGWDLMTVSNHIPRLKAKAEAERRSHVIPN